VERQSIADSFDAFFFDLDGVVYIGRNPTPRAPETLRELRSRGKRLRFLTNNPSVSREGIAARLNRMGVEALLEEVFTAARATAIYAGSERLKRPMILGGDALLDECREAGLDVRAPDGVIVGWGDAITMKDVREACIAIREGAKFIASNVDRTYPSEHGPMPAVGALVEMLRMTSGREPHVVGKPSPDMFRQAFASLPQGARCVMVGDMPEIDVVGAHAAGIPAVLMGTAELPAGDRFRPDARIFELSELLRTSFPG
jgi:HAD superfamily hydrolase (TIGR01450 family)